MKKKNELINMSKEELVVLKTDYEDELRKLRFEHVIKPLDNPLKLRNLRRSIARINTLLREYELGRRKE